MVQQYPGSVTGRVFSEAYRPSDVLQVSRAPRPHQAQPFRPLPRPTGPPPYHLGLDEVLSPAQVDAISKAGKLVFHMVGDTGGVIDPYPQMDVARQMERDFRSAGRDAPVFLYILGDVVYFYGESYNYDPQFYEPYLDYPGPIFAVPGNHDGNVRDGAELSLAGFVRNFCAPTPEHSPDAGDAPRGAMTQPNVYWTLEAPLITLVGVYTNVPEGGRLDQAQIGWLASELAAAPTDKALVVTMHHPVYSASSIHWGSQYMREILDSAMHSAGRVPTAVFSGHVHNYQRFMRAINGREVPYIVAGAGGYHHLHPVARPRGAADAGEAEDVASAVEAAPLAKPLPTTEEDVRLAQYHDRNHGYLRLEVTAHTLTGEYVAVPTSRGRRARGAVAKVVDRFTLELRRHPPH